MLELYTNNLNEVLNKFYVAEKSYSSIIFISKLRSHLISSGKFNQLEKR